MTDDSPQPFDVERLHIKHDRGVVQVSDRARYTTFLQGLSETDRDLLIGHGERRTISTRDMIFEEGSIPNEVMIVLSGNVMVTKESSPDDYLVVELRGTGDILGEFSVIDEAVRSAGAIALEDCELLFIEAAQFLELTATNQGVSIAVQQAVTHKALQSTDRQIENSRMDSLGRVCSRLVELCRLSGIQNGRAWEVPSLLSQKELATWVGVSRDAVVCALGQGRRLGWLETGRLRFVITDLVAIQNRALPT